METNQKKAVCLNCESETNGNFCQTCGQSTRAHRITFRETFNDFFSSAFALEGPLLYTLRLLIVNPGKLFREFIGGKRKRYYKPVAFFIVLTAIYIVVRALINYDPFHGQEAIANVPEKQKVFVEAGRFMVANINNIMFFLVFSVGLNQKMFFRKKYNLAEYITVGFYVSGIYILLGLLVAMFSVYVFWITPRINFVFLFSYLFYVSVSFHQKKSFWALTKYFLIGILTILFYFAFGYSFSVLMVSI
ncbi:MAG: DUF3667 domain-containing protein [Cyclobacteriaceae bacterium]